MTIYEAAAAATARLGREVNIRAVNRGDWEDEGDLFVRTIKNGALVAVPLPGEAT